MFSSCVCVYVMYVYMYVCVFGVKYVIILYAECDFHSCSFYILQYSQNKLRESDVLGGSTFSAHSIVTEDLAMKRVSAKFVPKLLTAEQKQLRVEVSQDMLDSTVTPTS